MTILSIAREPFLKEELAAIPASNPQPRTSSNHAASQQAHPPSPPLLPLEVIIAATSPITQQSPPSPLDMFVGGTDATSSLLEWTISELQRNKIAMTKLQNEVRQVSGSKSGITEGDLEELHYLKAVIKETLRLHPPIPLLVPRESTKAIKITGYDIAAGTQVIINAWAIGRDPKLWEDAEEFRPERFLNSSIDFKGQHYELIPFGSGRRSCPGSAFALVTAELALANLICNFDFELAGGARPEDLDMIEAPGIVTPRKVPLRLVASVPN